MNVGECRRALAERFRKAGFECAGTEADYIVEEALSLPHAELFLHSRRPVSAGELSRMESFLERRLKNEPFQYIFGWTAFREIRLHVAPGVLIPRPETEELVDLVLKNLPRGALLCELGAGSGAISLSVAFERPDVTVLGSEISPKALAIAEENRKNLQLENVSFFQGDLFAPFAGKRFHAVTANLPYIPWREKESLPPNVRDYEPEEALFADDDGFALIRRAVLESPFFLVKDSPCALVFELGEDHAARALEAAEETGFFTSYRVEKDLFGVPRVLCACRN